MLTVDHKFFLKGFPYLSFIRVIVRKIVAFLKDFYIYLMNLLEFRCVLITIPFNIRANYA
jgi:hypothetical protein